MYAFSIFPLSCRVEQAEFRAIITFTTLSQLV